MKVYLDNVIASALVRGDLALPQEKQALELVPKHRNFASLEIVTSRESWREQEHTQNAQTREELRSARGETPVVPRDHRVLGFNRVDLGSLGYSTSPLVTDIVDEAMFLGLRAIGLKSADARHLMYALCNGCVRFVTTDPDFLDLRAAIETAYPQIRIRNAIGAAAGDGEPLSDRGAPMNDSEWAVFEGVGGTTACALFCSTSCVESGGFVRTRPVGREEYEKMRSDQWFRIDGRCSACGKEFDPGRGAPFAIGR